MVIKNFAETRRSGVKAHMVEEKHEIVDKEARMVGREPRMVGRKDPRCRLEALLATGQGSPIATKSV